MMRRRPLTLRLREQNRHVRGVGLHLEVAGGVTRMTNDRKELGLLPRLRAVAARRGAQRCRPRWTSRREWPSQPAVRCQGVKRPPGRQRSEWQLPSWLGGLGRRPGGEGTNEVRKVAPQLCSVASVVQPERPTEGGSQGCLRHSFQKQERGVGPRMAAAVGGRTASPDYRGNGGSDTCCCGGEVLVTVCPLRELRLQ